MAQCDGNTRWLRLLETLLARPVQDKLRQSLRDLGSRPVGGDFSRVAGIDIPSFFRHDAQQSFVPILGYGPHTEKSLRLAEKKHLPIALCEDSFLRSATVFGDNAFPPIMRQSVSLTCDSRGFYFDATRQTDIEELILSAEISTEDRATASALREKIVSQKLSKYNNQPITCPSLPGSREEKVLVIDQDYGDTSTTLGGADATRFAEMLSAACDENPNADVLVKTHPDSLVKGGRIGYFSNLAEDDRIHKICFPINPYSILDRVSKVYVATSTFGFEALLAGKPVIAFGKPWYAGWGVTDDRQTCSRRGKTRSLLDLFHLFYVKYTVYSNPVTKQPCGLADAIDVLLSLRSRINQV